MENKLTKNGLRIFAAAFAQSLSASLAEASGPKLPLEIVDKGTIPTNDSTPIQFKLTVEGALSGECFVEFYEPQVAALLSKLMQQPVTALDDNHLALFTRLVATAAEDLCKSGFAGDDALKAGIERVSGLAFGGLSVVPLVASEPPAELHVLLFFSPGLLESVTRVLDKNAAETAGDRGVLAHNLNLVMDVELNVSLRFGQRRLPLSEILELSSGSIVELDRTVNEPVELYLDGKLIARGEAVIVDGNYGLRVTEIPQPLTSQFLN
ncbi:MAG: flagellar motor switch protein FliN [Terracidiphilus sp.]|jgi:flagellar motor switch protein FliN/FliY